MLKTLAEASSSGWFLAVKNFVVKLIACMEYVSANKNLSRIKQT